jgi:hypothetical protein
MHLGREIPAAAGAGSRRSCIAGLMVKLDADLGRTLKNVKELTEGQKEQSGYDGNGVQYREKTIRLPSQPFLRCG